MPVTVILGEQRGDEGKGRFTDMYAPEHEIVARFNGGSNAGHTVGFPDERVLALHQLPSGISHPGIMNVIGNGTVVNPVRLLEEIHDAQEVGVEVCEENLMISSAAHLVLPHHISLDEIQEAGEEKQGTTKSGIAPAYADKANRTGLRVEVINNDVKRLATTIRTKLEATNVARELAGLAPVDIEETLERYVECARHLGVLTTDTTLYLNRRLKHGDRVLAEGAQAAILDIDHGTFPAVTSSSTTIGGVMTGLGIPPQYIDRIIGVSKAVQSHVGGGPFNTEITDEAMLNQLYGKMGKIDSEEGTTTGRRRRLGYLNLAAIRRAQMINGTTEMVLTKLDWVPRYGDTVRVCTDVRRKGKVLGVSPDAAYKVEESEPIYTELPTWKEDVSGVRNFNDLPPEARDYVDFIEDQTGVPVTMIGVGPWPGQVINRKGE